MCRITINESSDVQLKKIQVTYSKEKEKKAVKENKRSIICAICGLNTGSYHQNYGASSCLSCRAFFRRAVQKIKGSTSSFVCHNINSCLIDVETRNSCKKCRFDRCINAGMSLESVMDREAIQTRFAKFIRQRKYGDKRYFAMATRKDTEVKTNSQKSNVDVLRLAVEELLEDDSSKEAEKYESVEGIIESTMMMIENPVLLFDLNLLPPVVHNYIATAKEDQIEGRKIIKTKLIRKTWLAACQQEQLDLDCVNQLLGSLAQREGLSSNLVTNIRARYERVFCHFAHQQTEYLALSEHDQEALLLGNSSHFERYLFSRVITSSTVQEQLQWLLLTEDETLLGDNCSKLRKIEVGDLVPFLNSQKEHLRSMNSHLLQLPCSGIIALICLYNTNDIHLESHREIESYQQFMYDCSNLAQDLFGLTGSQQHCSIMRSLVAMDMNYKSIREKEEIWVQWHLDSFDQACDQFSFGEDFVKECLMYSVGVPLTRYFLPRNASVWISRFHKIVLEHEEFINLKEADRTRLWTTGSYAAFAIIKAKKECCKTGDEQLRLAFRNEDDTILRDVFSIPAFAQRKPSQLKCIRMREWIQTFQNDATAAQYDSLSVNLAPLLKTNRACKLMAMLAMFNSVHCCEYIVQKYLAALKHHLGISSAEEEVNLELKIQQALYDIGELSYILQQLNHLALGNADTTV